MSNTKLNHVRATGGPPVEPSLAGAAGRRPERVPERLQQRLRADDSARKRPRDGRIGWGGAWDS